MLHCSMRARPLPRRWLFVLRKRTKIHTGLSLFLKNATRKPSKWCERAPSPSPNSAPSRKRASDKALKFLIPSVRSCQLNRPMQHLLIS